MSIHPIDAKVRRFHRWDATSLSSSRRRTQPSFSSSDQWTPKATAAEKRALSWILRDQRGLDDKQVEWLQKPAPKISRKPLSPDYVTATWKRDRSLPVLLSASEAREAAQEAMKQGLFALAWDLACVMPHRRRQARATSDYAWGRAHIGMITALATSPFDEQRALLRTLREASFPRPPSRMLRYALQHTLNNPGLPRSHRKFAASVLRHLNDQKVSTPNHGEAAVLQKMRKGALAYEPNHPFSSRAIAPASRATFQSTPIDDELKSQTFSVVDRKDQRALDGFGLLHPDLRGEVQKYGSSFLGRWWPQSTEHVYVDADPQYFLHTLRFFQDGHLPPDFSARDLRIWESEARYLKSEPALHHALYLRAFLPKRRSVSSLNSGPSLLPQTSLSRLNRASALYDAKLVHLAQRAWLQTYNASDAPALAETLRSQLDEPTHPRAAAWMHYHRAMIEALTHGITRVDAKTRSIRDHIYASVRIDKTNAAATRFALLVTVALAKEDPRLFQEPFVVSMLETLPHFIDDIGISAAPEIIERVVLNLFASHPDELPHLLRPHVWTLEPRDTSEQSLRLRGLELAPNSAFFQREVFQRIESEQWQQRAPIDTLYRACIRSPHNEKAVVDLGFYFLTHRSLPRVQKLVDAGLERWPESTGIRELQGLLLAKKGHVDEALLLGEELKEGDPQSPSGWNVLARATLQRDLHREPTLFEQQTGQPQDYEGKQLIYLAAFGPNTSAWHKAELAKTLVEYDYLPEAKAEWWRALLQMESLKFLAPTLVPPLKRQHTIMILPSARRKAPSAR